YYNKGKKNQIHVINDSHLELPSVGLVTFLGQSGSGKTTLLNVIGGLDKAKGELQYDSLQMKNYKMHKIDKYRKDEIGYIFQNYNLLPNKTVYENLEIALEMIGVTEQSEVLKRIEYTLKAVKMYKYRKKMAYALSGGQQQRVAIARALLKNAKIIIADEPTGNLDSENSIEVMNILKKISKSSLVLLVTHNVNIAKFYSDKIIEIKDGVIQKEYNNDSAGTLARNNSNTVYLKDMHLKQTQTPLGELSIYQDTDQKQKVNLEIIIRNNNIYIKSDKEIHLVETSNLTLIDDHYKDLDLETVEDNNFDTSWYEKKDLPFKQKLKRVFKDLYASFKNIWHVGKKGKMLNIAFFFIGLVLGASIICMINFATADTKDFIYTKDTYQINVENHYFPQDPIYSVSANFQNDRIKNLCLYQPESMLTWKKQLTFTKTINYLNEVTVGLYKDDYEIIYGKKPETINEVVIDKVTAEELRKQVGVRATYDDIMGNVIELSTGKNYVKASICGIVKNCQYAALGSKELYTLWACPIRTNSFGSIRYYLNEKDKNGDNFYSIVEGEELHSFNYREYNYEVLVKKGGKYEHYDEVEVYSKEWGRIIFRVVGKYDYLADYETAYDEIITNFNVSSNKLDNYILTLNDYQYEIVEGRVPVGIKECMVPVYSKESVGSYISTRFGDTLIVGKYNGTTEALGTILVMDLDGYIINSYNYDEIAFDTISDDILLEKDEVILSLYQRLSKISLEEQESNLHLFELLSFILILISSIFIYFTMRSRMISDIYSIGVYRCLGASRMRIIASHLRDSFGITTCTTFIGYILMLFIYNIASSSINSILKQNMFRIHNG
ncbi:MAG: ABC transporter ATP-binding protein, partial [Anaeroplasmataceae bacterium]|nr:ABC transporter ATP-binding protein [Anaeroplasmataceae bacterium]